MKERHGYWDEHETAGEKFKLKVTTLSPTDPAHCVSLSEAHALVDEQVLLRAKSGFKYLFTLDYFGPPWHKRYIVQPDGTYLEV